MITTTRQNEELQKKLTEITKANETAQKAHAEQLGKLQVQLKAQTEASSKAVQRVQRKLEKDAGNQRSTSKVNGKTDSPEHSGRQGSERG